MKNYYNSLVKKKIKGTLLNSGDKSEKAMDDFRDISRVNSLDLLFALIDDV